MELSKAKKKEGRYCCAYSCKNKPVARKGGLCHKHYRRKRRELDPVAVRFNGFKGKAKARGIDFTISLEYFRAWCKRTGYLGKGQRGQNATIDRRCNVQGYHAFNLQLLTNRQNASKGAGHKGDVFDCPF